MSNANQAASAANAQKEIRPGHGKSDVKGGLCSSWKSQEVRVGTGGQVAGAYVDLERSQRQGNGIPQFI